MFMLVKMEQIHIHRIASKLFAKHVHCIMNSVYFVCIGARADIKNKEGKTPLQGAEEWLAEESAPVEKHYYEKVHEDTHTITYLDNAIG